MQTSISFLKRGEEGTQDEEGNLPKGMLQTVLKLKTKMKTVSTAEKGPRPVSPRENFCQSRGREKKGRCKKGSEESGKGGGGTDENECRKKKMDGSGWLALKLSPPILAQQLCEREAEGAKGETTKALFKRLQPWDGCRSALQRRRKRKGGSPEGGEEGREIEISRSETNGTLTG